MGPHTLEFLFTGLPDLNFYFWLSKFLWKENTFLICTNSTFVDAVQNNFQMPKDGWLSNNIYVHKQVDKKINVEF